MTPLPHNEPRHRAHKSGAVKNRRHPWPWIVLILVLCAAACCLLLMPGAPSDITVRIPHTATASDVGDSITARAGGRRGQAFARTTLLLAKAMGFEPSERSGAYLIPAGTSPLRAAHRLARGAQQPVRVTVNGQRDLKAVTEALAARLELSADSLQAIAADPAFLSQYGLGPDESMALFMDDTYEVYWNVSPHALLRKIADNYTDFWNETRRAKAQTLGLTPSQAMALCSIADEETLKADEKGRIARLYLNRLDRGMKLQADPTVRYAAGDFTIRRVQGVHLKTQSPYNTYLHTGLPPGPIRTGRKQTVDALLDSKPSDDIYMCARADFSGYHDFAPDYATHQANARRYRSALDSRGIK